jgi:plasmid stabilization system protein ParE
MRKRLEVIWSEESARKTDDIIEYLTNKFSEKEVNHFLDLLKTFEKSVSLFPELYPESNLKRGYRRAVIAKQVSIIYSIDSSCVRVYTLFDNRQDPEKLLK